jgi:DNA helicase-2/ATP-dependent DNA helicase PcrA
LAASTKPSHPLLIVVEVKTGSLLDGLTAPQRAAVVSEAAPLCILAGAGAGKTRALTRRIAYRVATGTADPAHVLALTFTRKAAGELSERLAGLGMRDRVVAGTFHAIAYTQLRRWWADRGEPAPTLLDRKARLLGPLAIGRPGVEGVAIADLAAEIEWAQARLVAPRDYEETATGTGRRLPVPASVIAALYARYESEKRRRRLVDFDDLLARCAIAIEGDAGFAAAQRWRWRHVFVDEFQDVNPLQYRLLLAWLGPRVDLCVVGDPNQAIYAWNGADPGLLTGLTSQWPQTEVIRLDANHRSTPQVVAAAASVLGADAAGLCSSRPEGSPVAVRCYASAEAEAQGVAGELRRAREAGLAWSQLAVLMRTNAQAAAFEAACRAASVPCRVSGATSLLDDPAVKAALADVRRRGPVPFAAVIADLEEGARELAGPAPRGGEQTAAVEARRRSLLALCGLARDFQRLDPGASPAGFLAWLEGTVRAERAEPSDPGDAVTICTFHRAKGLGWPAVWVTGLEDGLVPIGHATTPGAQAEERRLLYVALTRAERELRCSWAESRQFGGRRAPRSPSPWLDTILRTSTTGTAVGSAQPDAGPTWRQRLKADRERLAATGPPKRGTGRPGRPGRPARAGRAWEDRPDVDPGVLDALRAWRASAARAAGVPPYVLFHDATLAALAAARPSTTDELLGVAGLGPVKARRYGSTLLALVAEHRASA